MEKYAVITGASSGIGSQFAEKLAAEGYCLILVARRRERLIELADRLHTKSEIITADLSRADECERLFGLLEKKKIEVFINNAGFGDCGKFIETNLDKEVNMIGVNVQAVHILAKRMLQKMQKEGEGYILNVASSAGLLPGGPYMATYYATKAYVTSLTCSVAEELRQTGSRVYFGCLCPGPVDTEFNSVANVEFALKGISAKTCAEYALKQMWKRKVVIVPKFSMKLLCFARRLLPLFVCLRFTAHQQKKKMHR